MVDFLSYIFNNGLVWLPIYSLPMPVASAGLFLYYVVAIVGFSYLALVLVSGCIRKFERWIRKPHKLLSEYEWFRLFKEACLKTPFETFSNSHPIGDKRITIYNNISDKTGKVIASCPDELDRASLCVSNFNFVDIIKRHDYHVTSFAIFTDKISNGTAIIDQIKWLSNNTEGRFRGFYSFSPSSFKPNIFMQFTDENDLLKFSLYFGQMIKIQKNEKNTF